MYTHTACLTPPGIDTYCQRMLLCPSGCWCSWRRARLHTRLIWTSNKHEPLYLAQVCNVFLVGAACRAALTGNGSAVTLTHTSTPARRIWRAGAFARRQAAKQAES